MSTKLCCHELFCKLALIKETVWLIVLGLIALYDRISIYIGLYVRERKKAFRNDNKVSSVGYELSN